MFSRGTLSSLALDVGGTFIKAARIEAGVVHEPVVRRLMPDFVTEGFDDGCREISPAELDTSVFDALVALGVGDLAEHDIYISGQMAGLAFVDDQGHCVENIITWQDTRYRSVDAIAQAIGSGAVADLGDGLRVGSPVVTLAQHQVPAGAYPMSLIGYVAGRIAGCRAERIHATDAGAWGLFDTRNMCWSSRACHAAGLDEHLLPRVVQDVISIAPDSRVRTPLGDQQAALFGAGLTEKQVSVNLATGCQVSIVASDFSSAVQTRPYLDPHYLHTVTHLPAGRLLASAVVQAYGEDSPMAWSRAVEESTSNALVAQAVETIVDNVCAAVEQLQATGREVLFSGGLIQRFGPMRDAILTRLGDPPSRVFPGEDAALTGLAALQSRSH